MSYCFQSIGCEKKHQQRGDQVDEHCDREGAQPVQWEQGLARAHRWRRHALSVSQVRWLCITLMLFDKDVFSQLLFIILIIARRTWTIVCIRDECFWQSKTVLSGFPLWPWVFYVGLILPCQTRATSIWTPTTRRCIWYCWMRYEHTQQLSLLTRVWNLLKPAPQYPRVFFQVFSRWGRVKGEFFQGVKSEN